MAFKKTEKKETKRDHKRMGWLSVADVIESKLEIKPGVTEYILGDGVYLTLYEDLMRVQIDVFGFCFYCKVVEGKNGYFLSYPAVQNKDKEWVQHVTCYDSAFNALVKELLAELAK